jgi:hypothetical protein
MAITKGNAVVHNDVTLTAGAADTTSTSQDLTLNYQTAILVRITNGATGPTVAAQCKVQVAEADTAGLYQTLATVVGSTGNSAVVEQVVSIPDSAQYLRTVSGSNTGQNVTLRVVLEKITAL